MDLKTFADDLVNTGREHGYVLGLKRANEIMREYGIDVTHPARTAVFNAMMSAMPKKDDSLGD